MVSAEVNLSLFLFQDDEIQIPTRHNTSADRESGALETGSC